MSKLLLLVMVTLLVGCASAPKGKTFAEYEANKREVEKVEVTAPIEILKFDENAPKFEITTLVIPFDFDKADLDENIINFITNNKEDLMDKDILVEGHCDERGTEEYNMELGRKRAFVTAQFLNTLGVHNVDTVSYGEQFPNNEGKTEEAYAKNRRAVIRIIK